jgi:CRISPR-associated protein Cmr4
MEKSIYFIEAKSNLQAGSGDANFGVIDNLVQRDATTQLPTINGSSLKGALKEHFEGLNMDKTILNSIFGSNDNTGSFKFLSALLLSIPLRANDKPYYMATSPGTVAELLNIIQDLGINLDNEINNDLSLLKNYDFSSDKKPRVQTTGEGKQIEFFEAFSAHNLTLNEKTKKLLGVVNDNLLLLNETDFKLVTNNNNLPVIARNQLDDSGQSGNLWYEQVVPRKSIFWTAIFSDKPTDDKFENGLKNMVHIGANASVGYGFTKFTNLKAL